MVLCKSNAFFFFWWRFLLLANGASDALVQADPKRTPLHPGVSFWRKTWKLCLLLLGEQNPIASRGQPPPTP